jgi:asparagine synthase (glutamine-hydrolysing)
MDEPIGDSAAMPNFLLSEMARTSGVKVILNGTGGDEIFGGYTRYLNSGIKGRLRNKLSIIVNSASVRNPIPLAGLIEAMDPLIEYCCSMNGSLSSVKRFLNGGHWGEVLKSELSSVFSEDFNSFSHLPDADRYMNFDIKTYLVGDLLFLLDKMTMAASVEGRVPLLDHRLVEFMSSIPSSIRIRNGNLKSLVKLALKGILPDEILERKKMGFGGPVLFWLAKNILDADCLIDKSSFCKESGLIDIEKISKIIKNKGVNRHNAQFFYNLIVFELWYKDVFKNASVN